MFDFLEIRTRVPKRGIIEIYPDFKVGKSKDLIIKNNDFYAIWLEDQNKWSNNEDDVIEYIDRETIRVFNEYKERSKEDIITYKLMVHSSDGVIDNWHKFVKQQQRNNWVQFDTKVLFADHDIKREDHANFKLNYKLEKGPTEAYDTLMGRLYLPNELHKLEWAIGAIIKGDSKKLQKFIVLYSEGGKGKGTWTKIVKMLFSNPVANGDSPETYCDGFEAMQLGDAKSAFASSQFKNNPLIAIDEDSDLSKITNNTLLNKIVSHEEIYINEKNVKAYPIIPQSFLITCTNEPVQVTSMKSGLIRRMIDVSLTGNTFTLSEYNELMSRIPFELGGIAHHCLEVYKENPNYYNKYLPSNMINETNDLYNFVLEYYDIYSTSGYVTLKIEWDRYKAWAQDAALKYPMTKRDFKNNFKDFWDSYEERGYDGEGRDIYNKYSGFKQSKFEYKQTDIEPVKESNWLSFAKQHSKFDDICKDCPAQYALANGSDKDGCPSTKWDDVKTILSDLDTTKLHYVRVPINHIVLDFDLKDADGCKSLKLNQEAASKLPPTYAELSKSGQGIHLHYIYEGDVSKLSNIYEHTQNGDIEIKVFSGKSSLRRCLTKCNDLGISIISSGLPLKKEKKKVIDTNEIKNEQHLRALILKCLKKECGDVPPATAPNVAFIAKCLDDAYSSGISYNVSDMYTAINSFAASSHHQAQQCLKMVSKMKFKSKDKEDEFSNEHESDIVFFDCEVFPNLFLINWKKQGSKVVNRMINPTPEDVLYLTNYRLVGFNCRKYDNHMLYARIMGESNEQLYNRSQLIVKGDKTGNSKAAFFGKAYNLSYTDIYDYLPSPKKKSLKKWEIQLGIHHLELGLPWDEPVPEEMWLKVAEYCDNDVISTEAVWDATKEDFKAREMLAKLANVLCPSIKSVCNDTTNTLTTRIVFRGNRTPQSHFIYTNLRTGERSDGTIDPNHWDGYRYMIKKSGGKFSYLIIDPETKQLLANQPDHCIVDDSVIEHMDKLVEEGKCISLNEGGFVWAEPGVHYHTITKDVASMHPHSIKALQAFGDYTNNYTDLVDVRVSIKHSDWNTARTMLNGALSSFIPEEGVSKDEKSTLSLALKTAINSVYGLTSASFTNEFRDPRNIDNIVAKRGALMMSSLYCAVKEIGGHPIHIKTDSIKLENPTDDILNFVVDWGAKYGYTFETESAYQKMCLVNDAVYIARVEPDYPDEDEAGKWEATGTQFKVPYVYKTLFAKQPITISDLCETKEVQNSAMYIDFSHGDLTDMKFVGRVGSFCPMKDGCGGYLYRTTVKKGETKYDSVVGTSGYEWLEAEEVINNHKENDIDKSYYDDLVSEARADINEYTNVDVFIDDSIKPKVDILRSSIN